MLHCSLFSLGKYHPTKGGVEWGGEGGGGGKRELLVAELLKKKFNKCEPLEAYFLEVSGETSGTLWDETGCSVETWNPFWARVKPVLLCSVGRALDSY